LRIERKYFMPTLAAKVIDKPEEGASAVMANKNDCGLNIRGNGNTNYTCGSRM
jgi:hypothetical protein